MKCKFADLGCQRINTHNHTVFYLNGKLIPDDKIEVRNIQREGMWEQGELWLNNENVGWNNPAGFTIKTEAKTKGYAVEEYNFSPSKKGGK